MKKLYLYLIAILLLTAVNLFSQDFAKKGKTVKVFVRVFVSVNGKPSKQLIDPKVDIANEEWHHFKHHDWILPSEKHKEFQEH